MFVNYFKICDTQNISAIYICGISLLLSSFSVSLSTGMEPGEHAAHTGSSKTRETHPGPSHLPGLSLHWIRGHGNQGQLKSHTHPTTLPHHLCCYAGFQTFQAMTTTLLPPSLSQIL